MLNVGLTGDMVHTAVHYLEKILRWVKMNTVLELEEQTSDG